MKRLPLLLLLPCAWALVFAQPGEVVVHALEASDERGLIQAERVRQESIYDKEDAECYLQFAVNDCLQQVRVRRREALGELRRRELTRNAVERNAKALERFESIKGKSLGQPLE